MGKVDSRCVGHAGGESVAGALGCVCTCCGGEIVFVIGEILIAGLLDYFGLESGEWMGDADSVDEVVYVAVVSAGVSGAAVHYSSSSAVTVGGVAGNGDGGARVISVVEADGVALGDIELAAIKSRGLRPVGIGVYIAVGV